LLHDRENTSLREKTTLSFTQTSPLIEASGPTDSGGFVCGPKSHLVYREYFESRYELTDKKFKGDRYKFTDDEKEKEEILNQTVKINCKAGSFILWDSRTFHCNTVPKKKVSRSCVYVCMLPNIHLDTEIIEKRKIAFDKKNMLLSSSW
jgi:hypothetical protein